MLLESGNEKAATFSAENFYQNSNSYVNNCIYSKPNAVRFYLVLFFLFFF